MKNNLAERETVRNFSGDRSKTILGPDFSKNKIPNNKLREILEESSALDLMKSKLMKKKEKLKANILNFSNPFNSKMQKIQLETSVNNNIRNFFLKKRFVRTKCIKGVSALSKRMI